MKKVTIVGLGIIVLMAMMSACSTQASNKGNENYSESGMMNNTNNVGMGGGGMMRFHMASIPAPYKNTVSPIPADEDSIARGQIVYINNCATCHGDGGMGDGPAGVSLDPSPAKIAHTSQMMPDDYLFWRISEGGSDFDTTMISFKNILSESDRWDVINYVRALGGGQVLPQSKYGGNSNSPEVQAKQQSEMLFAAIEQSVITQDEADFFALIHPTVDGFMEDNRGDFSNGETSMMVSGLDTMVVEELISHEEAEKFLRIHNLLVTANLMD